MSNDSAIAIIGMSGRFPKAKNLDEFWQNLRDGRECIEFFSDEELLANGVDISLLNNPNYVKANSVLADIDLFDAAFFDYSTKEAEMMDPQHRIFLEEAWSAIENAGYNTQTYPGSIGVYAGTDLSIYLLNNLDYTLEAQSFFPTLITNDKDYLPTRVSYKLNLRGPSLSVQTACSTSLVAVHLACQSLLNGECDLALAGGVSIKVPQIGGYLYQDGSVVSIDGHCRTFDAQAQGTVFGSGVGIVILKRLENAIADRDRIHAIIKGSAINNDGGFKLSYTAPSIDGQTAVISEAQFIAGIDPETITYIEAHGTATDLGDPIEVSALTQAFRNSTEAKNFCAIGSVKSNFGHLGAAAGIAGLIKTVLALKHQLIPPSLHFQQPNPKIDFANSPFYVNTKLSQWKTNGTPRRAGVSSFGIGGTNVHAVLEEAPISVNSDQLSVTNSQSPIPNPQSLIPNSQSPNSRPWLLFVLSAKTNSALEKSTANLADYLQQNPEINLADVAYTLQIGRRTFAHRRIIVCPNYQLLEKSREKLSQNVVQKLTNLDPQQVFTHYHKIEEPTVIFMFSGQGSQYINMARELYQVEPIFRKQVDNCLEILKPHLGLDLRDLLYPEQNEETAPEKSLQQTKFAQPALFVIEYALAQLWIEWGVQPKALIGHSIGEYVAATLAGVFSLSDALSLVASRGQLMQSLPGGSMLAVSLSASEIEPFLREDSLSLAVINSPSACVISGSTKAVELLEKQLISQGINCRILHVSHAFHSPMMEPILAAFTEQVKRVNLHPPQIPYLSNLTGDWITAEQATNPFYWAKHLRETVNFAQGLQVLLQQADSIMLEVGPGRTLSKLAKLNAGENSQPIILNSLRHPQEKASDVEFFLKTLGRLWLAGVEVNWANFYQNEKHQRLPLPTYPFERKRYWLEKNKEQKSETNLSNSNSGKKASFANQKTDNYQLETYPESNRQPAKREDSLEEIMSRQVEIMAQQIDLLSQEN
ncbi:type I polyketide synthase [Oscillatoria salina]|uniref:type I polyketide synthase n=1 Tax=Oscillatoria salina TaxID=331517 RepID=UPI0013B69459|nr:type I polyketide synthase [Oscillatoria salina]MBZ8179848.1 type I polyketide synthase [Oscillatoria salina IIICB1]NET88080.1 type I polyketide synthase [Kamptonema sp. SIO1D9]